MSSLKKTIQINPELFKLPNNKTKKSKPRVISAKPIISPNNLKNKLLKRIKEHKNKELKENKDNYNSSEDKQENNDEFNNAINYLSVLSKKQRSLNSNTYISNIPHVEVDLPEELENEFIQSKQMPVMNINYKTDNVVPYGCLKGGNKPTYRQWNKTQKYTSFPQIEKVENIRPPTPPKRISDDRPSNFHKQEINIDTTHQLNNHQPVRDKQESIFTGREQKLEEIKEKLRKIQNNENNKKINKSLENYEPSSNINLNELSILNINKDNNNLNTNKEKRYLKKTIRRKFTLGKSSKMRKVGVLLKDKHTRKNIINAQKELKRVSNQDVRKYLRQKGMIKVGTTAPMDLLRKTFETSMLAGEITNKNKDILIHNFLHESKE
jgi:hypothetical protein